MSKHGVLVSDKAVRELIKMAEAQGFKVLGGGGGRHVQIGCPNGHIITISSTPSDKRAIQNIRGDLRRNGLRV